MSKSTLEAPPAVIGHRGAMGHAPENTLASIREAARLGARWVEFDVALTKDYHPVIIHDETLDRTAGVSGNLAETELADVMHLDAGAWFSPKFQGETIPTLMEIIAVLAELGLGANVEVKPTPGTESETGRIVAERVISLWLDDLPVPLFSSFSETALEAVVAAAPLIPRAFLVHEPSEAMWATCSDLGCDALHVDEKFVTSALIDEGHKRDLKVRAFTVNTASRAAQLFAWGMDSVFSDFPERILPIVVGR